ADGPLRDEEACRDLRVAQPLRDQRQHLELACGEARRVAASGRARPVGHVPGAALAEAAGHATGRGPRTQLLQLGERAPEVALAIARGERQGALVAAAQLAPARGCAG